MFADGVLAAHVCLLIVSHCVQSATFMLLWMFGAHTDVLLWST